MDQLRIEKEGNIHFIDLPFFHNLITPSILTNASKDEVKEVTMLANGLVEVPSIVLGHGNIKN